ncbi:MAG: protoheme IX farnesyltransferase [Flavobacteriales bacterium]|nr:protoheme IX farnesyltransferase [Flavobacteriales bacterium]
MALINSEHITSISFSEKLKNYFALFKLKIAVFVVISSLFGYFIGMESFSLSTLVWLTLGGFLITAASNAFNQIIERDYDAIMERTKNRPLPQQKLAVSEALIIAFFMTVLGIVMLGLGVNILCGVLGLLAVFLYAAVYTPLKRITTFGVFVGAFPGAFPPMLGFVAATGGFSLEAGILFFIQFLWQFPHFWAIAWKYHNDYSNAGYKMLPFQKKNKTSAYIILSSSILLYLSSFLPEWVGLSGRISTVALQVFSFLMIIPCVRLVKSGENKYALHIMLLSYLYLIFSLLFIFFDKVQ